MSQNLQFSDSLSGNLALIEELLHGIPPSERGRARDACRRMEKAFLDLRKDYPQSAAVALGSAYAVYKIGQHLVENGSETDNKGLIQLLS